MKNTISLKTLLSSTVLGIVIFTSIIALFYNIDINQSVNGLVIFTFLVNGLIILFSLLQPSKSPYRLMDIVNVFLLVFMFAAPLVQYLRGNFPWWDTYLITDEIVTKTNLVILIFIMLFNLSYSITTKNNVESNNYYIKNIDLVLDIFGILTVIGGLFIIYKVGFTDLFARSTKSLNIDNQSVSLIIDKSVRSIPVIYVGLSLLYYQKHKKIYKLLNFFVGLIIMILVNFPTGLARFWIGSIYIGFVAIALKKNTKPNYFKLLLLFGLLVIFPTINSFRRLNFAEVFRQGVNLEPLSDYFLSGDFDAFSMLARSIIYTDQAGLSWGYQLLGVLLFFIPRSIWATKPVGSGYTVGTFFGWDFVNISMPLIGEGYINFGVLGVVFFAAIIGIIIKKMDIHYYYRIKKGKKEIYFIEIIFPFTLGFLFFILRGDLLSSWSYYVGFLVPIIILVMLNQFTKKSK